MYRLAVAKTVALAKVDHALNRGVTLTPHLDAKRPWVISYSLLANKLALQGRADVLAWLAENTPGWRWDFAFEPTQPFYLKALSPRTLVVYLIFLQEVDFTAYLLKFGHPNVAQ